MTNRLEIIIDSEELIEVEKTREALDDLIFWMLVGMSVGMLANILI